MKKALSVLLVAAALFGFYGSAVTVNDLLACKDYWEEAGEKSTADMNKLEDGLNQLKDNEQAYLDGLDQIADAEVQLAEGEATLAKGEADYAAAPAKLAKGKADLAAGWAAYNAGKKEYDAGKKTYNESKATLENLESKLNELKAGFGQWESKYTEVYTQAATEYASGKTDKISCFSEANGTKYNGINKAKAAQNASAAVGNIVAAIYPKTSEESGEMTDYAAYAANFGEGKDNAAALTELLTKVGTDLATEKAKGEAADPEKLANLNTLFTELGGLKEEMVYYGTLVALVDNREAMKNQIVPLLKKMAADEDVAKKLEAYGGVDGITNMLSDNGGLFIGVVKTLIGVADDAVADGKAQLAAGKKKLDSAEKQLAAGLKKLRKGEADYAQGLKDYAAAPAKLEDGRQQLADGYKQYEDGKNQLAQYEDGEQQIRDGLATLFNTEADLELESIANRLNGDGDFDNGDNHLEIDEGLNAVEVGRGYQAEDGVLITNEIMGRAVATGGLLAAAVLAVLAAILSFLNKNKGAGVFAILAAVAGAFGAFYGPAQGAYFSEIAGSTIGATTWVAAGVLGAVALVHAIAHFAAKKAA